MAEDGRDVLMTMTVKGKPVDAECSAVIGSDDKLASGFKASSGSGGTKGNYFSLQDFQIEIGLLGDNTASDPQVAAQQQKKGLEDVNARVDRLAEAQRKQIAGRSLSGTGSSGSFSRFMNKGRMAAGAGSYSSDLEPVSISKLMDASSLQLLDMCLKSTTIDSAVIIKRRGVGADFLRTYLRVEFTDLLITDFNWDEDDVIKEKIKFVCRKAQVQYSIENPDGSQGKPLAPGIWAANRQKS